MKDLEFAVLDELYFVTSFSSLSQATNIDEQKLVDAIESLLNKKYITQLIMEPGMKDFEKLETPDFSILPKSFFVATKDGLLEHNSRA
ncbi:MAG: hypothetical protein LH473_08050 [Chitinophagales bacterium]|nr:hypothetical protein [Chitinophagales bacterium]